MAAENTFPVEVLTPEGEVFSGEVVQVSTRTMVGEIGIQANHAPVLAALKPTELRLHVSGSEVESWAQAHGMMQVFGNRAQLLVEEAIPPDELDADALRQELEDVEQRRVVGQHADGPHAGARGDHLDLVVEDLALGGEDLDLEGRARH